MIGRGPRKRAPFVFSRRSRMLATAATVMLACMACFEPGGVASEPPQPVGGNTPAPAVFNDKIPTLGRMPEAPPAPAGRGSMAGILLSSRLNRKLGGTQYYLVEAEGPNSDRLPRVVFGPQEGDVHGVTNPDGSFTIADVPPGSYFMFVSAALDWVFVGQSDAPTTPRVFEVREDEAQSLGVVLASWP